MTDPDRLMLYRRGYGDGAKGGAYRHGDLPDYRRGYRDGTADASRAALAFCAGEGIAVPVPTRIERSTAPVGADAGRDPGSEHATKQRK